jgi:hypothetical protein
MAEVSAWLPMLTCFTAKTGQVYNVTQHLSHGS